MTRPEPEATVPTEPPETEAWTPASVLAFTDDPARWCDPLKGGTAILRPYATRIPEGTVPAMRAVLPHGMTVSELVREALRRELQRRARMAVRAAAKRSKEAGQ